jgi:hypothetical protein
MALAADAGDAEGEGVDAALGDHLPDQLGDVGRPLDLALVPSAGVPVDVVGEAGAVVGAARFEQVRARVVSSISIS